MFLIQNNSVKEKLHIAEHVQRPLQPLEQITIH